MQKELLELLKKSCDDLKSRIPECTVLSSKDKEFLTSLMDMHVTECTTQYEEERLHRIVDVLFPEYNWQLPKDQYPPSMNISWWNGTHIKSIMDQENGDFEVNLSSYIGGGETDTINGFLIKREWLDYSDEQLRQLCVDKMIKDSDREVADAVAKAEATIKAAQETLKRLKS